MKVLLINTYGRGGAAAACIRLHKGLSALGVESKLLLKNSKDPIAGATAFKFKRPAVGLLKKVQYRAIKTVRKLSTAMEFGPWQNHPSKSQQKFLEDRPEGLDFYSFPQSNCDITQHPEYQAADVINLHWVGGFLDWPSFFAKNKKPVVWTLHDQNPFLGGEHYAERYFGIDADGLAIPRLRTELELQKEAELLRLKLRLLKKVDNLHIVTPSKWLYESSRNSELLGRFSHSYIPNGFPTDTFRPRDRNEARKSLRIPAGKTVLLFVADSLKNNRKGFIFLKRAIEQFSDAERSALLLCAIGESAGIGESADFLREFGRIDSEEKMALAYSVADAFVIPSLEDNLPNTMVESLLCGTPVIGFRTGGIPDAVKEGETGILCQPTSVEALANGIRRFLANPSNFNREKIAASSETKYNLETQANQYRTLFKKIVNRE
jgi:glycosyltransferase involved in cell wall biosynthesis